MRRLMIALVAASGAAWAGPRDFVVQHNGFGATAQQAQPYLNALMQYVQTSLGWKPQPQTTFFSAPNAAFTTALSGSGFAMIDPDQVLELRNTEGIVLLATVAGQNISLGHVHLVVKNPAYKTLADLDGKTVVGAHVQSPRYVTKVMFDNAPEAKKLTLSQVASVLRAVKLVDRDQADAALLSDEEMQFLRETTFTNLHAIWTSGPLPPMQVSATRHATPADREEVAKMLLSMCGSRAGAAVCNALGIQKFTQPDSGAYDAAAKKMTKP
jgi:ABC-type phosphate/phosphonate transport system substrate-binding protein